MKRLWIGLLFIFLLACGNEQTTQGDGQKKIIVATDATSSPFEYIDKGEIVGFDIDLMDAIMKELNVPYEVKNFGWDPLFAAIQGGSAEVAISNITINEKRKETYDFSSPYFYSTQMILVPKDSPVANAKDLMGLRVGVQNGTTGQIAIEKMLGEESPNLKKFENNVVAMMEMKNGAVDAVVLDSVIALEYIKNNPNEPVKVIEDTTNFEAEYFGIMFAKDSQWKEPVEKALKKLIDNGTYTELYKKWFGNEPNISRISSS